MGNIRVREIEVMHQVRCRRWSRFCVFSKVQSFNYLFILLTGRALLRIVKILTIRDQVSINYICINYYYYKKENIVSKRNCCKNSRESDPPLQSSEFWDDL